MPGGSNDKTARMLEHIFSRNKLVRSTLTVVNKRAAAGISRTPMSASAPEIRTTCSIARDGLLSNHILGASSLNEPDFTPIALLFNDYAVFAVARQLADQDRARIWPSG